MPVANPADQRSVPLWLRLGRRVLASRRLFALASLGISLALGLASAWKLHEDDIFWQIRAGEEVLAGHPVQTVDEWSYTVRGEPWTNYQWLSTVIIALLHRAVGAPGLVVARVLVIAAWFLAVAWMLRRALPRTRRSSALLFALPFVYVSSQFRLHLRPEIFTLVLYTLVIGIWASRVWPGDLQGFWRSRAAASALLVALAANLHAGTAIFAAGISILFTLAWEKGTRRSMAVLLIVAAFFAHPQAARIIPELLRHFEYDNRVLPNTEWLPVRLGYLRISEHGWPIALWILFAPVAGLIAIRRPRAPGAYSSRFARWAIAAALGWMAFSRIRCIPYATLFLLPWIAQSGERDSRSASASESAEPNVGIPARSRATLARARWVPTALFGVVTAFLWLWILPTQVHRFSGLWGFSLNEEHFGARSIDYLARVRPKREVFANFLGGSYQLWRMPEYPVFVDPRDVIYDPVKREFAGAYDSGAGMRAIAAKYGIHAAFFDLPEAAISPDGSPVEPIEPFFPRADWAVVFMEEGKGVLLKRVAEHVAAIARDEYRVLDPRLPPTWHAFLGKRENDALFATELERCLREARNSFCELAEAAFLLKRGSPAELSRSLDLARSLADRTRRFRVHSLAVWARAAEKLGLPDEMAKARDRLARPQLSP